MLKFLITGIFLSIFLFSGLAKPRDTLVAYKLLKRIEQLQPKEDGVFPAGMFPVYRVYALNQHRMKADVNIFYNGLIAFTLRDIMHAFTPYQQQIARTIIERSLPVSEKFKNRKGRNTYNFWRTDKPQIFPNSGWLNLFDKSQSLPDDMDDTAIMLLAMAAEDSIVRNIHQLMQGYVNSKEKQITNTYPEFKNIGAYSTWFGKKMPVDFDISVLSNVLMMVQKYQLQWTSADSASLGIIVKALKSDKHMTEAWFISPHYNNSAIILYHVARLMAIRKIPELEEIKPKLIADALSLLGKTNSFMEKVILSTSLMKWKVQPPAIAPFKTDSFVSFIEDNPFYFFTANIVVRMSFFIKRTLGGTGFSLFNYFCPAYSHLLLLEYLAVSQS